MTREIFVASGVTLCALTFFAVGADMLEGAQRR